MATSVKQYASALAAVVKQYASVVNALAVNASTREHAEALRMATDGAFILLAADSTTAAQRKSIAAALAALPAVETVEVPEHDMDTMTAAVVGSGVLAAADAIASDVPTVLSDKQAGEVVAFAAAWRTATAPKNTRRASGASAKGSDGDEWPRWCEGDRPDASVMFRVVITNAEGVELVNAERAAYYPASVSSASVDALGKGNTVLKLFGTEEYRRAYNAALAGDEGASDAPSPFGIAAGAAALSITRV